MTIPDPKPKTQDPAFLLARAVWIDFSRRKDFFVLLSILLLFAIGAVSVRIIGVDSPAAARLLLSCGLMLASSLSAVLMALFASRMLPEEFEARTLYPLLAKPITRAQLLWAKFLGLISLGGISLLLFVALAWLPVPRASSMQFMLLLEAFLLQLISLAALAWGALWLSIRLPSMVTAIVTLMAYFLAGPLLQFAFNAASARSSTAGRIVAHVSGVVPDFSALRFFQAYVEGLPALGANAFLGLCLYGLGFAALFAMLCIRSFERKPL